MVLKPAPSLSAAYLHTSTCQFTALPQPCLPVTPCVREGDEISELNDNVKEAFGEQGGGVPFLYPHPSLGRKAPGYYIQQRPELVVPK